MLEVVVSQTIPVEVPNQAAKRAIWEWILADLFCEVDVIGHIL